MNATLHIQNRKLNVRFVQPEDHIALYDYFSGLSPQTRSRYGPHPFDRETIDLICRHPNDMHLRYVAVDEAGRIIAYMLFKKGWIEADKWRITQGQIHFGETQVASFAPSVADEWQGSGLGSAMYACIEENFREATGCRYLVLWGGVQAGNEKAVRYYNKLGFRWLGSFHHNEMENFDMLKEF